MKFCTPREGNPGNVLLTRRNPPKYFYQCGLENCESTQDCAGTEKTSERSCSMSSIAFIQQKSILLKPDLSKHPSFTKVFDKKIVLPNKKWQLLSSSFGHLQHSICIHNTSFGCNPSQLHNEITVLTFKLKIKHTARTVNNGKFGNPPGTCAGFPDSPSLMSCFIFNSYCKSNVGKFIGQDTIEMHLCALCFTSFSLGIP